MREYRVFSEVNGKWYPARYPFAGALSASKSTYKEAVECCDAIAQAWQKYRREFGDKHSSHIPTNFCIRFREVSEWEDVGKQIN